jgi:hypothetical protein
VQQIERRWRANSKVRSGFPTESVRGMGGTGPRRPGRGFTSPFPVVSSFGCTRAILISLIVVHAAEHHCHPLRPSPPPRSHHHDRITSTSPFIVRLDHTTIPPPRTTNVAIVPNVHVLPLLSMHASLTSLSRVDLTYFLDTPAFP